MLIIGDKNITQNSGYVLSPLNVDGQAVSAESNYTFINVVSNHTISATSVVDNSAPGVPSVSVSSKTTSSFTVNAVATDVDGDNLVYKLYVKQASGSTFSLKATSASTASGTAVSFTVSELGEYTTHNYYVTATDGKETSTSSTGSVRTYCSGTGSNSYYPPFCNSYTTCGDCNGSGTGICDGPLRYWYTNNVVCSVCESTEKCMKCRCGVYVCESCESYFEMSLPHTGNCLKCLGCKLYCYTHNKIGDSHYDCQYCSDTVSHIHYVCSHGKTAQHD